MGGSQYLKDGSKKIKEFKAGLGYMASSRPGEAT